jgi:translation initiation factor IF-2
MTVKEYALDINKDVKVVLEKCRELGFNAKNEDDMLSEDEVIDLDNQVYNEDEYNLEDKVEEIVSNMKNVKDTSVKVQKLKKKSDIISASDFKKEKKEMYKHKEKLMSNAPDKDENKIVYKEGMTLSMLANLLNDNPVNLIKKFMSLGVMLNMNSPVSFDDAELVVIDYNKELKKEETMDAANFEKLEITDDESLLETRPPVVTIMGHVDHGKTSLLDKIRESSIVSGEAGGITQHIGAYQVEKNGKKITFIDTPGHAAFTEMRARGAAITDIVIIIVAADDGVMPQTKEAIDHAKAAKVPIIVAINKIDKPTANVDKVMTEMTDAGLTPDSWGGDTTFIKISALTGEGIDELLETILLTAEMENLKANPNRYAMGSVIEAKLDKNVGSVVTLLIQNGTLRLGDNVVVGTTFGKVRTLKNDLGIEIASALPSTPVEITGLTELPSAGDKFMAFETEKQAKAIAETRKEKAKQKSNMAKESLSLDDLFSKIEGGKKEINVILKADVKGSEEAVKNSLLKINVEGVKVNVIRSATGAITESDVVLANASEAIIIGFNVRPSSKTKELAKEYNVDIRLHNIIYKVVEELESAMKGMIDPEYEEKVTGEIEVRKLFKFSKVGTIAGSYVTSGIVKSNSKARLIRDGVVIYDGAISSIQREKDTVKEVKQGFECGITLDNYNDIKEGDTIEAYEMVEIKR